MATNGTTDTQIISGVNGSGSYLPLSFYTNNALAMQIGTNGQVTVAATANPAFRAYASTNQVISTTATVKVTLDTEEFDTNNNFSSSRFTPTIAGYYQFSATVTANSITNNQSIGAVIYKNGSGAAWGTGVATTSQYPSAPVSTLLYMNGTTDYVELYCYNGIGGVTLVGNTYYVFMSGFLARSA
jgi:hypothetical protein